MNTKKRQVIVAAAFVSSLSIGCASQPHPATRAASAPVGPPPVASPAATKPERDDQLTVQGVMGTLDASVVEGEMSKRSADVARCHEQASEKRAWLGGSLQVKVRVNTEGTPISSSVQKPIGNFELERCVLAIVMATRFPAPEGNAEAEFSYVFNFRGKGALQEWGNEQVQDVFAANRNKLDACVRPGRQSGLPKTTRMALFITPGGIASSVGVGADVALDEGWGRCVTGEVAKWKFSDPRGRVAHAVYEF